ncbi:50S ribosomal protein L24 [Gammaproteobacteria bacterium]|jgi:large subunit ribosomal protein L24|uniref:Large ribosomal subunit protein uL24 n=1 Tax=OM182 bacterium MED-G28 TaxID=1986256 RepID=A0A2A5WAP0_9GAMM|nr:50S ribosomal protein L24 [Gammaproteobacteria bacterium]MDC0220203.1 50S ribosomal protein L24 [Gammaproteobacteria bacterium]MDG2250563.1 50S ribosomal protein L24 [Gammaproteobacteria bacterium]PDH33492.1 MAG: 50S ribosomal protein L24 [OM182 bacterium MED-G28]|tara:strand:+ start:705 stop:1016 length:312 start_codon:yes stop_codon:yes gene_type:complete
MNKLKRDDEVIVVTGKDKGKRGTVSQIAGDRVVVAGVNMVKRHTKPNPNAGVQGGIMEKEAALHVSNVAIFNPETNTADRVGIQIDEDGNKQRIFKSNGQVID